MSQQATSIAATAASLVLLLVVFELVRSRRLRERYALLWILTGIVLVGLSAWRGGLNTIAGWLGVRGYPPAVLFAVGLLFVIPGRGDTLRVNGRARLVSDAPFFDDLVVKGHRPLLALVVDIDEVFHHCAKAFMRSSLWDPETWDPEVRVPRRAVVAHELDRPESTVAELDEYYGPSYAEGLYRNPVA